jgi:hypothetical protein
MAREGGCEWYQSIGLIFFYISAYLKKNFKGPRPFKKQKTYLSGLTTPHGALLNQGASGVKNRIAERPLYGFCVIPEWGVLGLDYFYSMFFEDFFRNEKIHMHYQTKPGKQGFIVDSVCILHREIWIVHMYCNCL